MLACPVEDNAIFLKRNVIYKLMDLIKKKKERDKQKEKERMRHLIQEELFKKEQKPYMPSSKKLTIIAFILFVSVGLYIYFGSDTLMKDECGLMPGLECKNVFVTQSTISFEAHNFLKEQFNLTIWIDGCDGKVMHVIRPNKMAEYSFNCTTEGYVVRKKLYFTYVGYSGLAHNETGALNGKVT